MKSIIPAFFLLEDAISRIEKALLSIGYMDILSNGDSYVHNIEPRAKIIITLAFIISVVSFGKYEIARLMPFAMYPIFLISAGGLPALYLVKKVAFVSPFALMIAIFNPILDTQTMLYLGNTAVSGGMVSFLSVILRFFLTVLTALALIASTGFQSVCLAMNRLGMPRVFTVQLLFLYRYLFLLVEEAARMSRARTLRAFNGKGNAMTAYSSLIGSLLLRTINRAQRIHLAMTCRGFDGSIHVMRRQNFGFRDFIFIIVWCGLFIIFRLYNIPQIIGTFMAGLIT